MSFVSTGMGDHFGVLVVGLMALRFAPVDRNPFSALFGHVSWLLRPRVCLLKEIKHLKVTFALESEFVKHKTMDMLFITRK